jgi:hypothetical protein
MPIFFKASPKLRSSAYEPIVREALALDKIEDPNRRIQYAQQMLQGDSPPPEKLNIWWCCVGFAFIFMIVLFGLAIGIGNANVNASQTLLLCFELTFTATLGLFGIKAAKNG